LRIPFRLTSLVFFLAVVLLFQTVTFTPIALAQIPNEDTNMPSWLKNNVKWWNEGELSDKEIINAIQNLVKREIIKLDSNKIKSGNTLLPEVRLFLPPNTEDVRMPGYVKNTFVSWEEGSVSDSDVANTIKFLIEANIITLTSSPDNQPKPLAAIIDQLDYSIPNKRHQQKALEYLQSAGYDVDVYTTEDITIDFYKKLPSMNYEFIYIRTHSVEAVGTENSTHLFTDEKYEVDKYIQEQLSGQIHRGIPIYDQFLADQITSDPSSPVKTYFMIGSKFMEELTIGEFPQSVIIIGGCESVRTKDLANSLIARGAFAVIGWSSSVNVMENDRAMSALLEESLINKIGLRESIITVMEEFGPDMEFSSKLHYIQLAR